MLSFSCAICGTHKRLGALHAWYGAHPICSQLCNGKSATLSPTNDIAKHAFTASCAISACNAPLQRAAPLARRAALLERRAGDLEMNAPTPAGALFSVAVTSLNAQAEAHRAECRTPLGVVTACIFEVAQTLPNAICEMMALYAFGVPVVNDLAPFANGFAILNRDPSGLPADVVCRDVLALYQLLSNLHHKLGLLRRS